jgi:hypothetical protein
MTRLIAFVGIGVGVVLLMTTAVRAQISGAQASDPSLQAAIEARQKAIDTKDTESWSKYTAEEFMQVLPDGAIQWGRYFVAAGPTLPVRLESAKMFGPHIAVTVQRGGRTRTSLVWVNQNGGWQVVSAHSTRIAIDVP